MKKKILTFYYKLGLNFQNHQQFKFSLRINIKIKIMKLLIEEFIFFELIL